jgi:DNA (cytosine-5)-methyltransferase 1
MRQRPILLDLFCGAGGAAMGYHRAGFEIVGVDIKCQPHYPFEFHQADALEYLAAHGAEFDAIHASPPCQRYSHASFTDANRERHPDLVGPTRELLLEIGTPWVIENVFGSPLRRGSVLLCGLMFDLKVFRHRWFEMPDPPMMPHHPTHRGHFIGRDGFACVCGHGGGVSGRMKTQFRRQPDGIFKDTKQDWEIAMGIGWMTRNELAQAIPPAYTEFIGRQLAGAIVRANVTLRELETPATEIA